MDGWISATSRPRTETVAAYRADEGRPAASRYLGLSIGAIGVHTSGASPPGSSARHSTVRAGSRRREATGTCLERTTPLGPTPKGGPSRLAYAPCTLAPEDPSAESEQPYVGK